jgi:hypothetical protein
VHYILSVESFLTSFFRFLTLINPLKTSGNYFPSSLTICNAVFFICGFCLVSL